MDNSLPVEIAQSVDVAFDAMQNDPEHLLSPIYRSAIYNSINKVAGAKALKIKVILGILAVKQVVDYWKIPLFMIGEDENDYSYWLHLPNHLIEVASGLINGTIDRNVALKEASHLSEVSAVTGQYEYSPYYYEWCVLDAALSCVWEALNLGIRKTLETNDILNNIRKDEDLGHDVDTVAWACLAYTGGVWTPNNSDKWFYDKKQNRWLTNNKNWYFDEYGEWDIANEMAITRRKEFWTWWLYQAISESWHQF